MASEPEDPRDNETTIDISIEWDQTGDPYDWGLRYPNDEVPLTDAAALLGHIKETCRNSKSTFIRDWSLLDDPRIVISMRRPDDNGRMQYSSVEWDGSDG